MAQLLGINSQEELNVSFSFRMTSSFDGKAPDGWGYAFYRGTEWQSFKESLDMDKILRLDVTTMSSHEFLCKTLMSHMRYATLGEVTYDNTHPFDRDLFDSRWFFAHHGHLRLYRHIVDSIEYFKPIGDTDSEVAFCVILEAIRKLGKLPSDQELAKSINNTAKELAKQGGMNFLLSDGEVMHAFYSRYKSMYYTTLHPPFEEKIIAESDQLKIVLNVQDVQSPISIITTDPIIAECDWKEFEIGILYSFKNGKRIKFV
ncbi:MAG: class II glutamine amidotransferase [Candidatus Heimdallarchaeota archaeon]|nr:class II glutamine amidotransferase [Candidatus Heimdallarchaeota archaeon]